MMTEIKQHNVDDHKEHLRMLTVLYSIEVRTHRVRTPDNITNFLFRVRLYLQWIKEQEINMFCVILFHYAQNVGYFAR